jgi:hypothetical protein
MEVFSVIFYFSSNQRRIETLMVSGLKATHLRKEEASSSGWPDWTNFGQFWIYINCRRSPHFGSLFQRLMLWNNFDKQMGWATLWAIFLTNSFGHPDQHDVFSIFWFKFESRRVDDFAATHYTHLLRIYRGPMVRGPSKRPKLSDCVGGQKKKKK